MPKKISKNTYGLTEEEVCSLGNSELKAKAHQRGLSEEQMRDLKRYRRILRIRCYGKKFRMRERDDVNMLREEKERLVREKRRLEREVSTYKYYFIPREMEIQEPDLGFYNPLMWAEN